MIYIRKQDEFYQNKVNSSLVSTSNCKMGYYLFKQAEGLLIYGGSGPVFKSKMRRDYISALNSKDASRKDASNL